MQIHTQLRNGTDWVGLRVPDHPVALALLRAAGVPIAAPSANRSECISPNTAQHVADDYNGRKELMTILDGGNNDKHKIVGIESTILMIEEVDGCVMVSFKRDGAIGIREVTRALAEMQIKIPYKVMENDNEVNDETSTAPGKARKHYSPKHARTFKGIIREQPVSTDIGTLANYGSAILIAPNTIVNKYGGKYHKCYTLPNDSKECARVLYSTMREADTYCKGFEDAVIVMCIEGIHAEEGSGFMAAIKDKIFRASEGKRIKL